MARCFVLNPDEKLLACFGLSPVVVLAMNQPLSPITGLGAGSVVVNVRRLRTAIFQASGLTRSAVSIPPFGYDLPIRRARFRRCSSGITRE